jgi:hypothetical protein
MTEVIVYRLWQDKPVKVRRDITSYYSKQAQYLILFFFYTPGSDWSETTTVTLRIKYAAYLERVMLNNNSNSESYGYAYCNV